MCVCVCVCVFPRAKQNDSQSDGCAAFHVNVASVWLIFLLTAARFIVLAVIDERERKRLAQQAAPEGDTQLPLLA